MINAIELSDFAHEVRMSERKKVYREIIDIIGEETPDKFPDHIIWRIFDGLKIPHEHEPMPILGHTLCRLCGHKLGTDGKWKPWNQK